MRCELCGGDPTDIALLPIQQPNGNLTTIACISCAEETGTYCLRHGRPHLGFEDGTHACIACIEFRITDLGVQTAQRYFQRIETELPAEEFRQIM